MYWFRRPPYLRWVAAALIVVAAVAVELRRPATTLHPFLKVAVTGGESLGEEAIEWREVPAGLLPLPELSGAVAARAAPAGEPLLPSSVAVEGQAAVPENWWALPLALPPRAFPGDPVQLVVVPIDPLEEPLSVPGLVVERAVDSDDPFAPSEPAGLVAVPGEASASVAAAAAEGRVMVTVAP
ncbi:MAG: hypothetical protein M3N51_06860 [Actinomycetota bacterium]|nr:hypothetical protein [Actinomycetota bacterium]